MTAITEEDRDRLIHSDPHFRALADRHKRYEERLDRLRSQRWLSEDEQIEEVKLKKMKLAIKDEMEAILRKAAG